MESHDYDAVLLLSFGGPEKMEDVRPFLENVTRGRGIPPERLDEVGEHYKHFDGKSPLNDLNREIIANLRKELAAQGIDLPVYFGNRNWHPLIEEAARDMHAHGIRRVLVFATSAWAGYSGCRQYHEDIAGVIEDLKKSGIEGMEFEKLRGFHDHPLFIRPFAEALKESIEKIPADRRATTQVIFTAHSIPNSADETSGPADLGGFLYSKQVAEAAALIAEAAGVRDFDVVWQSRSGPAHVPWLEPDIVDHVEAIVQEGVDSAVVCPVGFISDHVEVAWDLDAELQDEMAHHDIIIERVPTPGPTRDFTRMIVELIREKTDDLAPRRLGKLPQFGSACNGTPCAEHCCVPPRRPRS